MFATRRLAAARLAELKSFQPPLGDGYDYQVGTAILRLSNYLTPAQASAYLQGVLDSGGLIAASAPRWPLRLAGRSAVPVAPVRRFAGRDDSYLRHGKDEAGSGHLLLHEGPRLRFARPAAACPAISEGEAGQEGVADEEVAQVEARVAYVNEAQAGG
ncbi:MAG: hypothetical protein ACLQFR_16565 [Streptosporangiaceae bacterium]